MFILLSQILDARATGVYLDIIWCVIDSYLDKELDAFDRVEAYVVCCVLMRYWWHLLLLNKRIQAM